MARNKAEKFKARVTVKRRDQALAPLLRPSGEVWRQSQLVVSFCHIRDPTRNFKSDFQLTVTPDIPHIYLPAIVPPDKLLA